ncbi:hypothetical protein NGC52_22565 [Klebsiella michiganensis]|uniref:hypothetical protein n=1 Tax=Klebsiella TaxID=570 RepID=UPI0007CA1D04|nr:MULTISPECIES: hypothetical protein [Klebsiella]HBM9092693.1 hypothetical protein [Klebsiella oxytoca]MBF7795409.1 hypothetical protein [Klebsiella pneumoniae]MBF7799750.1 hypothetical protein [Klebsiella pneumoniae]MEB7682519.1 hypothetical protein [Klebsiella michiganensis]CAA0299990.1 Uncharacterised protein [Klebsiella pneumoniae]
MRKTFQVYGFAVNKRGHTLGIHYTLDNTTPEEAKLAAQLLAQKDGYKHIRINFVREVFNV